MKARVVKPKTLEKQRKHYLDLLNDLVWNRSKRNSSDKNFSGFEGANHVVSSTGLGVGVSLLAGGVIQQYATKSDGEISEVFHSEVTDISSFMDDELDMVDNLSTSNYKKIHAREVNTTPSLTESTCDEKYLPTIKLNDTTYGAFRDRYNAIFKKIYNNKRLIQREDLQAIDSITKSQNTGGITLITSSGAIMLSAYSKTLSPNLKMRAFQLGFVGFFASIGSLSHSNWKFSKFLSHLNEKYFYATSIKDLQDEAIIKTNKPRNMSFEGSTSWSLKSKLPSLKTWFKQD